MALVFLALAWFASITAMAAWDASPWMAAAWIVTASPALLLMRPRRRDIALAAGCAVTALVGGAWFAQWEDRPPPALANHTGQTITIEGYVEGLPSPGRVTQTYTLRAQRVLDGEGWESSRGGVRLTVDQYREYEPGDTLRVTGLLEDPPVFDTFDYRAYLARHDIVGTLLFPDVAAMKAAPTWDRERLIGATRVELQDAIERALPEPEASLGSGIVLGLDGGIPDEVEEDFRRSGLAHFVAVSGSNIQLVTVVVFLVLTPLVGRRWAVLPAAATIVLYAAMAGAEAPVLRAGVMAAILLGGWLMGRHRSALAALSAAAVVMTLFSPGIAVDVGFQMSVAATAGLIVFAPWLRAGLGEGLARARIGGVVPGKALDVVALSLAANVAILPIAWVTFDRVSLIGVVANLVVAPVFALSFWATGATALLGAAWTPAGWAAGLVAYYPLTLMVWTANAAASVPGSSIATPDAGPTSAIAAYVALAVLGWPAYRYLPPETSQPGLSPAAPVVRRVVGGAVAGMTLLAMVSWTLSPMRGPDELRIEFLDVGQGDAILLTTPAGTQILVDGGPSGIELMRELGDVMPHWDRHLDTVLVTHPQTDHLGGLAELARRFDVGSMYDTGVAGTAPGYDAYIAAFPERDRTREGRTFSWDGVTVDVLWPPASMPEEVTASDVNDTSIVLRVTYGDITILLTGDLTAAAQRTLMASTDVTADVLKVPHHGSKTTAPEFLDAVGADVAVITVGANNPYGHPTAEILSALGGSVVARTDDDGRVTVTTDGHSLRVATER